MRATRASLSCSRTALTDAPPTSTIFLSLAAKRSSLRARSRRKLAEKAGEYQPACHSSCQTDLAAIASVC